MPDEPGTRATTGEGVTELVIARPHGGSATVQCNPDLVIEHPGIRYAVGVMVMVNATLI